jgi:hypothetical protein
MLYSPLRFYFADILYFVFYSVRPNLGHFGTKPVGLLPCASMQFSALVHPVQPTLSMAEFSTTFSFLQWMSSDSWLPWLLWLPVPLYGPCLCCLSSMAPPAGPAPRQHAHHAAPPAAPSRAFPSLQPPFRCSYFLVSLYFLLPGCCRPRAPALRPPAAPLFLTCLGLGGVLRY